MDADLFTKDLKKKAQTNRPFWIIGEPDINVVAEGARHYRVEVIGFDYYDPLAKDVASNNGDKIAMWMLDTDYDGKSIFPTQIFFPMRDAKRDWSRAGKSAQQPRRRTVTGALQRHPFAAVHPRRKRTHCGKNNRRPRRGNAVR